ncbi:LamG-like jellyroll fold domain-containing protein [Paramicrobacterium sp. CJ85]|uniref:LamG-like jellyroll fold domain-containing protein n=1 Tax=Paramicrobacterium sp. CJ85 TaxID=3445355 RepID=UPI003F5FD000
MYALGTDNSRYLFSSPSNGDGNLRTALTRNGGGAESQNTGVGPLHVGEWVDLAVKVDTEAKELTTYLNGVAVVSTKTDISAAELLTDEATSAGYIGKSFYVDPMFNGAVDDFKIYRAALTPGQVAEISAEEAPTLEKLTTSAFAIRTTVGTPPRTALVGAGELHRRLHSLRSD